MTTITATQLAKKLSDILNRIRYRREEFLVERNGEAVAKLGPAEPAGITWKEFLERYPDLPRPDDTFADDLEQIQAEETPITATELARGLSDFLNRVRYRGEAFVIQRNGENIARLTPAEPPGVTASELVRRVGDLPMPGDGFADDLEATRASLGPVEPPAWPC